jgi:hypothetical protein
MRVEESEHGSMILSHARFGGTSNMAISARSLIDLECGRVKSGERN